MADSSRSASGSESDVDEVAGVDFEGDLGPTRLSRADVARLLDAFRAAGLSAQMEADGDRLDALSDLPASARPKRFLVRGSSAELTATLSLAADEATLSLRGKYEPASALLDACDAVARPGRSYLAFLTHGDFSIVAGAAAVAGLVMGLGSYAPARTLAAIGGGLWFIYLMWVRRNQTRRMCVLDWQSDPG